MDPSEHLRISLRAANPVLISLLCITYMVFHPVLARFSKTHSLQHSFGTRLKKYLNVLYVVFSMTLFIFAVVTASIMVEGEPRQFAAVSASYLGVVLCESYSCSLCGILRLMTMNHLLIESSTKAACLVCVASAVAHVQEASNLLMWPPIISFFVSSLVLISTLLYIGKHNEMVQNASIAVFWLFCQCLWTTCNLIWHVTSFCLQQRAQVASLAGSVFRSVKWRPPAFHGPSYKYFS